MKHLLLGFMVFCLLPLSSVAQLRFLQAEVRAWAGGMGGRHGELLRMEGKLSCSSDSIFPVSIKFSKGGEYSRLSSDTEWSVFYESVSGTCKVIVLVQSFETDMLPKESAPVFQHKGKVLLKFKCNGKIYRRRMKIKELERLSYP